MRKIIADVEGLDFLERKIERLHLIPIGKGGVETTFDLT